MTPFILAFNAAKASIFHTQGRVTSCAIWDDQPQLSQRVCVNSSIVKQEILKIHQLIHQLMFHYVTSWFGNILFYMIRHLDFFIEENGKVSQDNSNATPYISEKMSMSSTFRCNQPVLLSYFYRFCLLYQTGRYWFRQRYL